MTDNQYLPAKVVVWRHPCHCPSASRPLAPGEEAEHRFDVDGKPFPWHIAENGASFTKCGDVYLVKLEIYPIEVGGNYDVLDITLSYWRRQPRIGERLFPWAILRGSLAAEMDENDFPALRLTFIAEHVDADVDIPELDTAPRGPADVAPIDEARAASIEAEAEDHRTCPNHPGIAGDCSHD